MKKIIVDKSEGIAEIIDRMLAEPDGDISFVIPTGSALARSVSNFHLLRREADSAGRTIVIESVDETILAFAKEAGIESSHPLWKGVRGAGGMSDIVRRDEEEGDDGAREDRRQLAASAKRTKKAEPAPKKEEFGQEETFEEEAHDDDEEDDDRVHEEKEQERRPGSIRSRFFDGRPDIKDDDDDDRTPHSFGPVLWWIAAIIVLAAGALYLVTAVFDHADITINFEQTPWSYQGNFIADKNAVGIDPSDNTIPAQIFTTNKNYTGTFQGSSVQQVSQKAQGMITIYNDYSTKPQELIATTRFLTPAGQIFRIVNNVTVPGATMTGGTLTPSSITVPIVADQPGPSYNIGPVAKLSIPGFDNSPALEAGFYGSITASTTDGFIGQRAVPTAADIAAAKASTTALLAQAVWQDFQGTYPNNFNFLPGATTTQVGALTVNTTTDANGDFTVFGEATLTAIGFDQSALQNYLLSLAQTQEASSTFKSVSLNYSDVSANFTSGQVSFALSVQGELEPAFTAADFVTQIEGMSVGDARSTISALPQLSDGEISLWPSWLGSIPSDPAKIHVTVN